MTDETFLLIYYGLLICFLLSVIAALLVMRSMQRRRRAARQHAGDLGQEHGPKELTKDTVGASPEAPGTSRRED